MKIQMFLVIMLLSSVLSSCVRPPYGYQQPCVQRPVGGGYYPGFGHHQGGYGGGYIQSGYGGQQQGFIGYPPNYSQPGLPPGTREYYAPGARYFYQPPPPVFFRR